MSYLVLARKWRPQRFEDIAGQGHITRVLRNAIRSDRIAHAYLFTGVRGVGKTTAARIMARALNCEGGPTPTPCNQCTNCSEILEGRSLDVYEIDGASNRGIDEIRQIIENARYQPAKSRFKIYIIDEVHQITKEAFNALLKTLEEPPPFVKFILATTEPHRLPETILSRCQRFDFRRIAVREIIQRLSNIAGMEKLHITNEALLLIAREAEGSMRDAQSQLEQIISYAVPSPGQEESEVEIDENLLQDILGVTQRKILYDFSEAVIQGDAKKCLDLVADVIIQGRDMTRLSRELVEHFRNLLVVCLAENQKPETKGAVSDLSAYNRLLDVPDQELEILKKQVSGLSADVLMDYFRFMGEGDEEVGRSAYPRFSLEVTLARLASLPKSLLVTEVVEKLEKLERKLSHEANSRSAQEADTKFRPAEKVAKPNTLESPTGGNTENVWREFVNFVMKEKKFLGSHLERAQPLNISPGQLRIGVSGRHHLIYLQDSENLRLLTEFAARFFANDKIAVGISILGTETKEAEVEPVNAVSTGNEGENDIVEEALRIFEGSVKRGG
ncbi:MAG: DNA polymerase III subunit gamma/tau [Candidatus Binatia bacterium]